jgi:hypothetical protein
VTDGLRRDDKLMLQVAGLLVVLDLSRNCYRLKYLLCARFRGLCTHRPFVAALLNKPALLYCTGRIRLNTDHNSASAAGSAYSPHTAYTVRI